MPQLETLTKVHILGNPISDWLRLAIHFHVYADIGVRVFSSWLLSWSVWPSIPQHLSFSFAQSVLVASVKATQLVQSRRASLFMMGLRPEKSSPVGIVLC